MRNMIFFILFFHCLTFCFYMGCAVQTHVLDLRSVEQPIQMGALQISQADSLSPRIASYQTVSGNLIHEIDEGSTSSDENSRLTIGRGEYAQQTLFSEIDSALQNRPDRFIADVQLSVEVEHGISVGTLLASILGAWITEDETEPGEFTSEKFYLSGKTYEIELRAADE